MGHTTENTTYQKLAKRIDANTYRTPINAKLYKILKELYSEEDAEVILKMPYTYSSFERVSKFTGYSLDKLRPILDSLVARGLVIDICPNGVNYFLVSPMVIGIFEFTMMRKADDHDIKKWAGLFSDYLSEDAFYAKNFSKGEKGGIFRTLPHIDAIKQSDHTQILDYETASHIIDEQELFSVELCACRREEEALGRRKCDTPLETCTSFGFFAETLVRNGFESRYISKSEVKEKFAQSKELGLVLLADNVKQRVNHVCHCCGCCCNALKGVSMNGYTDCIVTSNYIVEINDDECEGCGKCVKACHIDAIKMVNVDNPAERGKKKEAILDKDMCIGCGVCALKCEPKALKLAFRGERLLTPETIFEKLILQHIEAGTLATQLFDKPQNLGHAFMRSFMGAFTSLTPVKKALVSKALRSTFFSISKLVYRLKGNGWAIKL